MTLNRNQLFLAYFSVVLLVAINIIGCANIQRPMGGPRDRTPPKLLLATPANQTRNFKAKQIKLDFDEYFKLNNAYQEITISPAMENLPEYKVKQKSLVIDFKDSLQKNTTYVINFGKAIGDVNENNILKNFTYVFSTGQKIDSLNVTGNVVNTLTQEKEKDVTVMLIPLKQDSIWGKKKPSIFTTTDSSGNFSMSNLKEGDYKIYALKETATNRVYDSEGELVAFDKRVVHLTKDTADIKLSLFKPEPDRFRIIKKNFETDGRMTLIFNQPVEQPGIKVKYPPALDGQKVVSFTPTRDTARIFLKNMDFDSIAVAVTERGQTIDSTYLKKQRKESFTRNLTLSFNVQNDDVLKPGTDVQITANFPIESTDQSRITILEDSLNVNTFTLQKDPNDPQKFALKYRWRPDRRYEVAFNEGTFVNIYGDRNKRQVRKFKLDKPENYGTLTLHVTVPDSTGTKNYLVELLNDQKKLIRTDVVSKKTDLVYKDYLAGKYRVRVVYDNNKNGRWDSGNIKRQVYPENIWVNNTVITLRPNWDAEQTLEIPKEQTTP